MKNKHQLQLFLPLPFWLKNRRLSLVRHHMFRPTPTRTTKHHRFWGSECNAWPGEPGSGPWCRIWPSIAIVTDDEVGDIKTRLQLLIPQTGKSGLDRVFNETCAARVALHGPLADDALQGPLDHGTPPGYIPMGWQYYY